MTPPTMVSRSPQSWATAFFRGEILPWQTSGGFFHQLLECVQPQRAHLLLVEQLLSQSEKLALPVTLTQELTARRHQAFAVELLRQEEVCQVVAALADAGLTFLLFKGTPLAYSLYSEASLRDRCDTDLLFENKEAAEKAWLVLQGVGYKRLSTVSGELVTSQFPCTRHTGQLTEMLDVHWATSNAAQLRRLSFQELWEQSVVVPELGPAARAPCHVHALILACLHRLAHVKDCEENKLIWLYDIHLLLQTLDDEQWWQFMVFTRDKALGGACWDGVENAVSCFGAVGFESRQAELRRLAVLPGQQVLKHGSVLQRDLAQLCDAADLGQRLQLLGEYLFPPVAYMHDKYSPRWLWLLPYYYAKRAALGLGRRLRDHLAGVG